MLSTVLCLPLLFHITNFIQFSGLTGMTFVLSQQLPRRTEIKFQSTLTICRSSNEPMNFHLRVRLLSCYLSWQIHQVKCVSFKVLADSNRQAGTALNKYNLNIRLITDIRGLTSVTLRVLLTKRNLQTHQNTRSSQMKTLKVP